MSASEAPSPGQMQGQAMTSARTEASNQYMRVEVEVSPAGARVVRVS